MSTPSLEIYSDTVCPWCYVGLRRLEAALAARPGFEVEVRWLPFELNPDLPDEGVERDAYLQRKFGDPERFAAARERLRELGTTLGIDFRFDRITRMPNTRRSHLLIAAAGEPALQSAMHERLLRAYFSEGRDIGDTATLLALSREVGLETSRARVALEDPAALEEVIRLERQAQAWGISGVPTFIFSRRYAFSGAQEVPVFLEAIDRVTGEQATHAAR